MNALISFQLQTVYQDEYLTVQVDDKLKFIFLVWLRHPNGPEFRRLFQKAADITIEREIKYWLSDARAIHCLEFADQNWLVREMAPLLKKTSLLKFARLTTPESLMLLDATQVYEKVGKIKDLGSKVELELFTDKEVALTWLFSDVNPVLGNT